MTNKIICFNVAVISVIGLQMYYQQYNIKLKFTDFNLCGKSTMIIGNKYMIVYYRKMAEPILI